LQAALNLLSFEIDEPAKPGFKQSHARSERKSGLLAEQRDIFRRDLGLLVDLTALDDNLTTDRK
jgi:hypothetical protein